MKKKREKETEKIGTAQEMQLSSLGIRKRQEQRKKNVGKNTKTKKRVLHCNPVLKTKSCLSAQMARSITRLLESKA